MARRKTSTFDDLIMVVSKLPWWVCILLALVSYLALHAIADIHVMTVITTPGQLGNVVAKGFIPSLAKFGQYVLPFVFCLGALVSAINSMR